MSIDQAGRGPPLSYAQVGTTGNTAAPLSMGLGIRARAAFLVLVDCVASSVGRRPPLEARSRVRS